MSTSSTYNKKINRRVAESGMLIALMIVVQLLTFAIPKSVPLVSQLFTGSLVNFVLIVGAATVGFTGTVVAAILSPILAFSFGQLTFPQLIPVVAIGNSLIVAVTWAFFKSNSNISKYTIARINFAGILAGASAKTVFLWSATSWLIIPMFFAGKLQIASKLALMFSWPQFITAMIGGILALFILPVLHTYRNHRV